MPARTTGKVVEIKTDLLKTLNKYREWKKRPEVDLTNLVNNLLWEILTKEMMTRYLTTFESLEILLTRDHAIFVKDKRDGLIYEVYSEGSHFYCYGHKKESCEHISYALTVPESGRLEDYKSELIEGKWNPKAEPWLK